MLLVSFFFFKQKTAYEMRISDWSSDVCSSDLTSEGMAKVEIYTKAFCGYCARAKRLLDDKGVAYEETDITMGGPKRAEMIERAGGRMTVPQIFIDGDRKSTRLNSSH